MIFYVDQHLNVHLALKENVVLACQDYLVAQGPVVLLGETVHQAYLVCLDGEVGRESLEKDNLDPRDPLVCWVIEVYNLIFMNFPLYTYREENIIELLFY